ncbi:MAG: diguanylate cyclase domain-containing protein [Acidimicrobiales bacterium]
MEHPAGTPELANSMLGAMLGAVAHAAGSVGVSHVLAESGEKRSLTELQGPDGWSTYAQGLALFRAAAHVLHDPDIGRKAGVELLRQYAGSEVLALLRSLGSPGELVRAYPAVSAKQSTITVAEVVDVGDDRGLISVVSATYPRDPLFCGYTVGALSQFPVMFGMEPAVVEERECQTRGDGRCLFDMRWDPTSSVETSLERELGIVSEQLRILTQRFESLESVARDLASTRDVNSMLDAITKRAGVAVRAPRYLLVAQLPGEAEPRIHSVGFTSAEAETAARDVVDCDPETINRSRLVVDIRSARSHFGRLAAFYPDHYAFLPQERSLLMAYAGHAAAALETAAALDEARDRNTTLSTLMALGRELAEATTEIEVAQRLSAALPTVVRCDEAHVLLWDSGDVVLRWTASSRDTPAASTTAVRGASLATRLLEVATSTVASVTSDPILASVLSLTGLRSAVVTPIVARNILLGVLVVNANEESMNGSVLVLERMSGVASLAATTLDGLSLLDEVRHQALHDPLTDLANSRLLEDRVTQALSLARRSGDHLALLFVDLDHFKAVNDTYGHKIGDELLCLVAERLRGTVRDGDTVARIGGDEFAVLIQGGTSRRDAEGVADKVVAALRDRFVTNGVTLTVGASVGLTLFPEGADTYDTIVCRADSAMYQAKASGRGQYQTC